MDTAYTLQNDPDLKRMQEASIATDDIGLKVTHGVVGSESWWKQIESGVLQVETVKGSVTKFWPGHFGDYPGNPPIFKAA
jgi:hypothetical protein